MRVRLQYECFLLYPVNPVTAARLRQAFFPSGAKDERPDAELLLDLLTRHRDRLRPLEPDTVETRLTASRESAGAGWKPRRPLPQSSSCRTPQRVESRS